MSPRRTLKQAGAESSTDGLPSVFLFWSSLSPGDALHDRLRTFLSSSPMGTESSITSDSSLGCLLDLQALPPGTQLEGHQIYLLLEKKKNTLK